MKENRILDLLYPPRCPVCDRLLAWEWRAGTPQAANRQETVRYPEVCGICQKRGLPTRIAGPICMICGKPLENERRERCHDCSRRPHVFLEGRAAFAYRGMEGAMYRFKNGNRRRYAGFFGRELEAALKPVLGRWEPEVLVPIPIHASRRRSRGYNQAELLAGELEALTGIPSVPGLLVRARKTKLQRRLNDVERRANVQDAFVPGRVLRDSSAVPKRVLLVDDIYTTGSTMDAAAGVLQKAGVKEVYCGCSCIGRGY